VAAVLYGVGSRLDHRPELLFVLRGVDAEELISADMALPTGTAVVATDALAESGLAEIFGIDIETGDAPHPRKARKTKTAQPRALPQNGQAAPLPKKRAARTRATNSAKGTKTKSKKPRAQKTRPRVFDPKTPTGAAIVLLRKQAGLSVADFADSLGVSAPSVLRWEDTPGPLRLHARPLAALTRMQEEFSSR
jgi:DNA-binding transcriptional regulator YiaG